MKTISHFWALAAFFAFGSEAAFAQAPKPRTVLAPATPDKIHALAFSPDGKTLALACEDKLVKLWDVAAGKVTSILVGHADPVFSVAFSRDGKLLASASITSVKVWQLSTSKEKASIATQLMTPVAFSDDNNTLLYFNLTLRMWHVAQGKEKPVARELERVDRDAFALSPDGKTAASASRFAKDVYLWDLDTGKKKATLFGHTENVQCLAFSPDGKTLASGGEDHNVVLWNVTTGKEEFTLNGHRDAIRSVTFSPDGKLLAACHASLCAGETTLWEVAEKKRIRSFDGLTNFRPTLAISPTGKTLAAIGFDRTLRLLDVATGRNTAPTPVGHTDTVTCLAFSPDGKALASGGLDQTVRIWDLASGKLQGALYDNGPTGSLTFSRDGKLLAAGGLAFFGLGKKSVKLWDVATGKSLFSNADSKASVIAATLSADGKTLAYAQYDPRRIHDFFDGDVVLWDLASGKEKARIPQKHGTISSMAFTLDGSTLACARGPIIGGGVSLWDMTASKLRADIDCGPAFSVVFSPDGKVLGVGGPGLGIYDAETGKLKAFFRAPIETTSIAFSADGTMLASGHSDKTVRLWNVATTKEIARFEAHKGTVFCVAFSPDSKTLASAGMDKTILLWDVPNKETPPKQPGQ